MPDSWGGAWGNPSAWGQSWGFEGSPEPEPVVDNSVGGFSRRRRRIKRPQRRHVLADGTVIFASPEEYQALVEVRQETTTEELHELEAVIKAPVKTRVQEDRYEDAIIRVAELSQRLETEFPTFAPDETRDEMLDFVRLMLKVQADDDEMAQVILLM